MATSGGVWVAAGAARPESGNDARRHPTTRLKCHSKVISSANRQGRWKFRYALRKQTVEPVFGIVKSVLGFRQFSLRGLDQVRGEWNLVCLAWNLKRMAGLRPKFG